MGKFREWYIAIIGIGAIAGGLYVAALTASDGGVVTEPSKEPNKASAAAPTTAPVSPPGSPVLNPPKGRVALEPGAQANKAAAAATTAPQPAASAAPPAHDTMNMPAMNMAAATEPAAQPSAAAPASSALPVPGGDPAAGRLVFRKCQVCHSLDAGKDILGPSLAGIVGHKSGAEPNYAYSPAMKQANLTWDAKTLDAYLNDPQKLVPGNKMPFPGLKTAQDRADVIDFLAAGTPPAASAAAAAPPATA